MINNNIKQNTHIMYFNLVDKNWVDKRRFRREKDKLET